MFYPQEVQSCLGAYIMMICKRDDYRKPRSLVRIWKIIVKIQSRVLYYVVGSFLVELARDGIRGDNNELFGVISGEFIGILAIIMLVAEFSFSFMITKYFVCMLPSSGIFLAAKGSTTEILTLIQKFTLHIMMISIDSVTQQTSWIIIVVQILFCAARNGHFFYTLPLYSLSSLTFQGSLLMIMKSLTLAYFFQIAIKSIEIQDNFVWIVWIILSILSTKICHAYLKNTTINFILNGDKKITAAGFLMNKIIVIRQILKNDKKATQISSHYDWSYLFSKTISLYTTRIFGDTPSSSKLDFQDPNVKELIKKAIAAYLEENLRNFPRSGTLKLFTGYYYTKKLKLYELGIKYLREAQKSSSFVISLNAFLVLNSCQEELIKASKDSDRALDMNTYSRSRSIVAKLELSIIQQAELQEEFYQEVTKNSVNLGKIYQIAQIIKKQRENVKIFISKTLEIIPEYYPSPILTCAHYFAGLNFDFEESKIYQNLFSRRYAKYEKQFEAVVLCEENLYQRKNDFLVASSEKASAGITLYNSRTLVEGRGRDLKGLHFSMGLMPIFTNEIMKYTKMRVETGDRELKGKIMPYFIYHFQNGHISPTFSAVDINPYLGNGVQDLMFSRPVSVPLEHLVLSENGKVEYYTSGLAKALDLDRKPEGSSSKKHEIHITQICQELEKINQAFNFIAFPEKYNKEIEFQELYNQYTTTGKSHKFQSLNLMKEISYHCQIQNVIFGKLFVKFVTLEKLADQPDYETPKNQSKNEEDVESDIDKDQEIVQIPTTSRHKKSNLLSSTLKTTSQTENPLSTERESNAFLLTTQRNLSSPQKLKQTEKIQSTEENFEQQNLDQRHPQRLQTKTTNHTQKQTDRFEVNTAYKLAVNTKYYAPHYRLVIIFMYLLFTFLLIFQVISKVENSTNIRDLDGQGQALLLLEQRSNDILWGHGRVTLLWEFTSGFQDQTLFPPSLKMPLVAIRSREYAQIFAMSNKNILSKTHFLPADLQNKFLNPLRTE